MSSEITKIEIESFGGLSIEIAASLLQNAARIRLRQLYSSLEYFELPVGSLDVDRTHRQHQQFF